MAPVFPVIVIIEDPHHPTFFFTNAHNNYYHTIALHILDFGFPNKYEAFLSTY
jgi:hypothetical protein